jgi:2-polyprenyl-6-methoxyphenol hydroxylase-like FAD-dependent oxidoreductase
MSVTKTTCCVVGGGPAGMMVGYLLARAGVAVTVLEKHADFLRDFRGDTIHPSTLEILGELGLLDEFLQRPHDELREVKAQFGGELFRIADFSRLRTRCRFIAFMPQWHFLDFLADKARGLPNFQLLMLAEGTELLRQDERVVGVKANGPDGEMTVTADLVIAADGRTSRLRDAAGLAVTALGAPIDVLWFRIGRDPGDTDDVLGRVDAGSFMVTIDRGDYWQCAYVIAKGAAETVKARPLAEFRQKVAAVAPHLRAHIDDLADWDAVKLLSVAVDRLETWSLPGLLCIGDAAHAMSPVGGVGINLAIQDAVAAANLLAAPLKAQATTPELLDRVRRRRAFPAKVVQGFQVFVHKHYLKPTLTGHRVVVPFVIRLLGWLPFLRGLPARFIGLGVRPEHVAEAIRRAR